jgi:hypothetical protein
VNLRKTWLLAATCLCLAVPATATWLAPARPQDVDDVLFFWKKDKRGTATTGVTGGKGGSDSPRSSPAPEPVTLSLIGIGAAGVGYSVHRRRKRKQNESAAEQA